MEARLPIRPTALYVIIRNAPFACSSVVLVPVRRHVQKDPAGVPEPFRRCEIEMLQPRRGGEGVAAGAGMKYRIALTVLQVLGALSLLPYPAVLVASIMAIAGEGPRGMQRLLITIPYILLSLYPLVWIALFVQSWRLLARGATGAAFGLSLVPILATLAATVWLMRYQV